MERITYSLLNKTLTAPDIIVCNADNDTIELAIDSTGTIYETWEKRCDLAMADGTTDILGFSVVNTDVIAVFTLTSAHLKKGALVINPYVQDNGARKGFPKKSVQVVSQLSNDSATASVQVLIEDYIDTLLTVKSVTATTLENLEPATATITIETDGTSFAFGLPKGIQGVQGIQGLKGNRWRGAYSGATAYVVDDVVSYLGSSYICILASTNNLPTNVTYWSLFATTGTAIASNVTNTPAGGISATNVQSAINELDTEKVDKLMATNLVTNGDFSNGTTGWTTTDTISSTSNTLTHIANGSVRWPLVIRSISTLSWDVGKKILVRARIRVTNANCDSLLIRVNGSTGGGNINAVEYTLPVINQWYTVNVVVTRTTQTGSLNLEFAHIYVDTTTANGKILEVQYVSIIDLTNLFGSGNEPTVAQMDYLLSNFPNSWFNGTAELINYKQLLDYVIDLDNAKANRVQEAWITPTLLNGWTAVNSTSNPVGYYIDTLGRVWLRGLITGGTLATTAFQVPIGYRPLVNVNYITFSGFTNNNTAGKVYSNATGNVLIGSTANVNISLDGISWRAI